MLAQCNLYASMRRWPDAVRSVRAAKDLKSEEQTMVKPFKITIILNLPNCGRLLAQSWPTNKIQFESSEGSSDTKRQSVGTVQRQTIF